MTTLYLDKDCYGEQSREAASDDEWDRGDTSTSWEFGDVTRRARKGGGEAFSTEFEVKQGTTIYVVVAVWSTGNSFGRDFGECSEVMGCFQTYEEAEAFEKDLNDPKYKKYNFKDHHMNKPWSGYFESLDYTSVLERTVKEI